MTANRALLENNNTNMAPKLSGQNLIFFKVSFVPKPLYQIDAYRAGYQTRDQEF